MPHHSEVLSDPRGNTSAGRRALRDIIYQDNDCSKNNTAFGDDALENLNGNDNENTAFGAHALENLVDGESTAVGAFAGAKSGGTGNVLVGNWAMRYNNGGSNNTVVGYKAMAGTTAASPNADPGVGYYGNGSGNTVVGSNALRQNTSGINNTTVGVNSGTSVITESNNTLLGANTAIIPLITYGSAIGSGAVVGSSNSIVLGRTPLAGNPAVDKVGIGAQVPLGALHVNGNHVNSATLQNGVGYAASVNDYIIIAGSAFTTSIILPPASVAPIGQTYFIKNISGGAITITSASPTFTQSLAVGATTVIVNIAGTYY
jgi:hypothetical protein